MKYKIVFLLVLGCITTYIHSSIPAGVVKYTTGAFANGGQIRDIKIDSAGKIVACGYTMVGGQKQWTVARFTTIGVLDTTFNAGGTPGYQRQNSDDSIANALVIQADGKIVVAGKISSTAQFIRYSSAGAIETTATSLVTGIANLVSSTGVGLCIDNTGTYVLCTVFAKNNSNATVGILSRITISTAAVLASLAGTAATIGDVDVNTFAGSLATAPEDNTLWCIGCSTQANRSVYWTSTPPFSSASGINALSAVPAISLHNIALPTGSNFPMSCWSLSSGSGNQVVYRGGTDVQTIVAASTLNTFPFNLGGGLIKTPTAPTTQLYQCACSTIGSPGAPQPVISRLTRNSGTGVITIDATFGTSGITQQTQAALTPGYYGAVVIQADGKAVVGGFTTAANADGQWILARYLTTGTPGALDTTFTGIDLTGVLRDTASPFTGGADALLYTTTITPAGNLVVGGQYNNTWQVISYTTAAARTPGFGSSGVAAAPSGFTGGRVRALALDSTGRIIATGASVNGSPTEYFTTVRYNSTGTTSATVRETAYGAGSGYGVEVASDNSFLITGSTTTGVNDSTPTIITYSSAFAQTEVAQYSAASMVPGAFYSVKDTGANSFAAGAADDTAVVFSLIDGTGLLQDTAAPFDEVPAKNGIMYGGMYDSTNNIVLCGAYNNIFTVVRYTSVGDRNPFYVGDDGVLQEPTLGVASGYAITQDSADSYYVAAQSTVGSTLVFTVVKYLSTGLLDTTFGTGGIVQETTLGVGKATAIKINADGMILVGGQTTVNGVLLPTLIAYDIYGTRIETFGTNGVQTFSQFGTGTLNGLTIVDIYTTAAAGQMGNVATVVEIGQSSNVFKQILSGF